PKLAIHRCSRLYLSPAATTHSYTLSLHDALPICRGRGAAVGSRARRLTGGTNVTSTTGSYGGYEKSGTGWITYASLMLGLAGMRSEEHTSELQSQSNLVCRLLLEKKKTNTLLLKA